MKNESKKNIFIVGSKGIPGNYGGYETFVDKLTEYHQNNQELKYHVACKSNDNNEFEYHNARCFNVKVPNIGAAQAIYYDVAALNVVCKFIKNNNIKSPIVYILACRIGPFAAYFKRKIHQLGGQLYVNPDGHEWLRAKWSKPVRKYWKLSEKLMVKYSDLLICDSVNIEKYIQETYSKYKPKTTFIAYGADLKKSLLKNNDEKLMEWYRDKMIKPFDYYLVVGRFVPENNYKTIISEFMKSKTKKCLVLITNVEENKFYDQLKKETHFENDSRIKFVGTVYEKELIKKIRENAYGYLHGHSVGGTNPSLIEALATTDLNLLYDVGFNKEVAEDGAFYWSLNENDLSSLIDKCDNLESSTIEELSKKAKQRIQKEYTWQKIANEYERIFKL